MRRRFALPGTRRWTWRSRGWATPLSRAINGVPRPIFHKGEQVGEYRHYDERLTMFLLRYRDPTRYGKWLDRIETRQRQDGVAGMLSLRVGRMLRAAWRAFDAAWRGEAPPPPEPEFVSDDPRDAPR